VPRRDSPELALEYDESRSSAGATMTVMSGRMSQKEKSGHRAMRTIPQADNCCNRALDRDG
jgi:hypothetical protein